jgi:hypothetical protein
MRAVEKEREAKPDEDVAAPPSERDELSEEDLEDYPRVNAPYLAGGLPRSDEEMTLQELLEEYEELP